MLARLSVFFLLLSPFLLRAQDARTSVRVQTSGAAAKTIAAPRDFPDEPFVIERYATKARFEKDGTGEIILTERIRVQSDAGVQQLSKLTFHYNAQNEQLDLHYLRVLAADGKISAAETRHMEDSPAPEVKDAPAYSNYRQDEVTVPALAPGATIEYEIARRVTKPQVPGEFWIEHSFLTRAIVLNEEFEVSLPDEHSSIVKSSPRAPYQVTHQSGRAIYIWKHSNTQVASENDENKASASRPPDIRVTSFQTWAQAGAWYASLLKEPSAPPSEIRDKVAQIVSAGAGSTEKIEALYNFVSKQIRFVNLPFGAAGYQPRDAADILASGYGDAQDKSVLFTAMLNAADFAAEPALLSSAGDLDSSVPSPGELDRILVVAHNEQQTLWMDASEPAIPFRMLAASLRSKAALQVSARGAEIAQTPRDPPFESLQSVEIHGQVSPLGKLTASVHYLLRGDNELALRLTFERTPAAQWNELAQTLLALDGLHGDVISVKPGDPASTRDAFPIDIEFQQAGFMDWSAARSRALLPLPNIGLPSAPEKISQPIELGSPLQVTVRTTLDLPPRFAAVAPVGVAIDRDYAAYRSSYKASDQTLVAERSLDFKQHELAATRRDDFDAFGRAVTADENQSLLITNSGTPEIPADAKVEDLYEAGHAALNANNFVSALPLLERVVSLSPSHKTAWGDLGLAYLQQGKPEEAAAAFEKQLVVDPSDARVNGYLGNAFEQLGKFPEAIAAFHKQVDANPLDAGAHTALGAALLRLGRDAEAAGEFEKAAILAPKNASVELSLGEAYVDSGDNAKALAAFEKAASLSPTPRVWNTVAVELADHAAALDQAHEFAQKALTATSLNLRHVDATHATAEQWESVNNLAIDWDTLGWVYFQKGDFAAAERYISAAWQLGQNGPAAEHLAQIYIKQGNREKAEHLLALALAAAHPSTEARARLTLLLGGNAQIDALVEQARPELAAMRTSKFPARLDDDATGNFILEFSNSASRKATLAAAREISGSESLKPFAERLKTLDIRFAFPDTEVLIIPRQGTLTCNAKSGECVLALIRPEEVATR